MTGEIEVSKKTIEEICNEFEMDTVCIFGGRHSHRFEDDRKGCLKVVKVKFEDLTLVIMVDLDFAFKKPYYRFAFKCPKCKEIIPISSENVPKEIVDLLDTPDTRERLLKNFCNLKLDQSHVIVIKPPTPRSF
jgi:hypothetical protein